MASRAVMVLVMASLIVGCGSDDARTARTSTATPRATATAQASTPTADATASAPGPIVGHWKVNRTCDGMVEALDAAGLRKLAPAVVNDYFPDQSPQRLARKPDVCAGAKPQQHSHFFTKDGQFGSVDQHNEQVDDAPYSLVGKHTLHLATGVFGVETYRYKVAGDELTL